MSKWDQETDGDLYVIGKEQRTVAGRKDEEGRDDGMIKQGRLGGGQ